MTGSKPIRRDGRDYLSTVQTAHRLGVKPETVYAYVSRGLLASVRVPGVRGSLFAVDDVEALASREGARRVAAGAVERIRTQITLLQKDRLYYRGREAAHLADFPYEQVAQWLWRGEMVGDVEFRASADVLTRARRATAVLPADAPPLDRLRIIVDVAGACDPLRDDLADESVISCATTILACIVDSLASPGAPADGALARRLWAALTTDRSAPHDAAAEALVNAALVLLADHDLAASTLAARVAASTRANPYAVVATGLGSMDGTYHGAATSRARRLLETALAYGPRRALAPFLSEKQFVPGFGHAIYEHTDPRATALFARLAEVPGAETTLTVVQEIVDEMRSRRGLYPNSDLALAALSLVLDLRADAPETIFAVARIAGWIAHALEEYGEPGLRFRVPGTYVGVRPVE